MANNAYRPKKSLLFDADLSEGDLRLRNQYLDVGLNPDKPGEALVGGEGLSSTFGRNTSRLLDGLKLGGGGARTLTNREMTSAWALKQRSPEEGGSFYDDMDDPRHQTVTKKFWSDRVDPMRRAGGGMEQVPSFELRNQAYQKYEADQMRKEIATRAARDRYAKAERGRDFDVAVAQGKVPGAAINPASYTFGSGGTMQRGGRTFDVPMGLGQERRAEARPTWGSESVRMLPGMIDPDSMPRPHVIDRRYNGSASKANPSRTGATAKVVPGFDVQEPKRSPRRGWDY